MSLQTFRPNIPDGCREKLPFSVIISAAPDVAWAGLPMSKDFEGTRFEIALAPAVTVSNSALTMAESSSRTKVMWAYCLLSTVLKVPNTYAMQ